MFLKKSTMKYTKDYYIKISKMAELINSAEAIVIGAGAGLSTSAGFVYDGENFNRHFNDFEDKYGFKDMYTGGFYKFETKEEYWAYWSRYIYVNRFCDIPTDLYKNLLELVKDKNYFVITTNVDHCFQKSGFDKERLFYTQGDYGLFQCSVPCSNETYENKDIILKMVEQQENMRIPSELIPLCPNCGKEMTMNLRSDNLFVENDGWHRSAKNYSEFIDVYKNKKILFIELGVGFNTPSIIKYPFWQMTFANKNANLISINFNEALVPKEIEGKSVCFKEDIYKVIKIYKEVCDY
ncbi:MAG: SIR2 family NAD-dependent protein deacylase [Lachnospirales bacterium]